MIMSGNYLEKIYKPPPPSFPSCLLLNLKKAPCVLIQGFMVFLPAEREIKEFKEKEEDGVEPERVDACYFQLWLITCIRPSDRVQEKWKIMLKISVTLYGRK